MKLIHNKSKHVDWQYPCIAISDAGAIALFKNKSDGVILGPVEIGFHRTDWDMSKWKPLPSNDSITLSND
jgi:hypothetical protein